ncbi:MAG: hypothetical protein HY696_01935 [Deltaproteobacteria bacterium]|nr:hypothetical protein [Deltaproteobacteria bacterium]
MTRSTKSSGRSPQQWLERARALRDGGQLHAADHLFGRAVNAGRRQGSAAIALQAGLERNELLRRIATDLAGQGAHTLAAPWWARSTRASSRLLDELPPAIRRCQQRGLMDRAWELSWWSGDLAANLGQWGAAVHAYEGVERGLRTLCGEHPKLHGLTRDIARLGAEQMKVFFAQAATELLRDDRGGATTSFLLAGDLAIAIVHAFLQEPPTDQVIVAYRAFARLCRAWSVAQAARLMTVAQQSLLVARLLASERQVVAELYDATSQTLLRDVINGELAGYAQVARLVARREAPGVIEWAEGEALVARGLQSIAQAAPHVRGLDAPTYYQAADTRFAAILARLAETPLTPLWRARTEARFTAMRACLYAAWNLPIEAAQAATRALHAARATHSPAFIVQLQDELATLLPAVPREEVAVLAPVITLSGKRAPRTPTA